MTTGGCVVVILIKKRKEREFSTGGIRVVPPRLAIIIPPSLLPVVKELQTIYESFVNTACIFPPFSSPSSSTYPLKLYPIACSMGTARRKKVI